MLRLPPVPALIPVLALLLSAPPASAQVYKWKDAHGTVQYTQSPPPEGVKFQAIKTSSSDAPLAAPTPAPAGNRAESDTAEPTAAKPMADTPENRSKMCVALRANLAALNGSAPVVMAQNGKTVALDADQRKQQAAATQAQLQQYCQ